MSSTSVSADKAPPSPALVRRATLGATVGSIVEWFDVAVYGYLAVVIGQVFFGADDPTTALLSSFAVFAAAFIVRPLGGIFFGFLGDRVGRQKTLAAVILLVSAATFGIGVLPGQAAIGVLAPVLLVTLRLLQGFSAGGEMGGASAFVAEYAPPARRGFLVSLVEMGCILGFLLGSLTVLILNLMLSQDQVLAWGWRIPFLLAAPLGLVGLFIRSKLEETPEFTALRAAGGVSKNPLKETVTKHWRAVLIVGAFALFQNAALYVVLTFVPSHLTTTLGHTSLLASTSSVVTMAVVCLTIPLMGALSDRIGRKRILATSCVSAMILSYPLFLLMEQGDPGLAMAAHIGLGIILGIFLGPVLATMNELFTTAVRYGGFSLGYNLSVSMFGGTAPFLVTLLIAQTGVTASPGFYIMAAALITFVVLIKTKETAPRLTDARTSGTP
ncbi:MFS transporter [Arthrobacter sp. VKM Ac-2550]|uniref:MFS transporter n=1 Tax=Crystallibacter permensis TaxID=1938888 RepID=UPI0022274C51|nr:MFS transporter [Arthrobacter sp. VKM Ac-2550]MCW2130868.1 MFS transporter, MHS family, proline/betaine transporter [Arthrobacter sp. VKM Ac-2550]